MKPGFLKEVDPLMFLPQEICDKTLVPQEVCLYSDQELESVDSLRTLKYCDLRMNGHFTRICTEPEDPQEPQELLGLRCICKHTTSNESTKRCTGAQEQVSVSTCLAVGPVVIPQLIK